MKPSQTAFREPGLKHFVSLFTAFSGLQRILEKTIEAEDERAGWDWPDRSENYLRHTYCFYILDTVRMSFGCKGGLLANGS
jgi:hypothetical protein